VLTPADRCSRCSEPDIFGENEAAVTQRQSSAETQHGYQPRYTKQNMKLKKFPHELIFDKVEVN
jgi:hypothetical protein